MGPIRKPGFTFTIPDSLRASIITGPYYRFIQDILTNSIHEERKDNAVCQLRKVLNDFPPQASDDDFLIAGAIMMEAFANILQERGYKAHITHKHKIRKNIPRKRFLPAYLQPAQKPVIVDRVQIAKKAIRNALNLNENASGSKVYAKMVLSPAYLEFSEQTSGRNGYNLAVIMAVELTEHAIETFFGENILT